MSESPSADPVPQSAPEIPPAAGNTKARILSLVTLLLVMAGALWYDRMVARPAVEKAYAQISQMNDQINSAAGNKYLTKSDIQKALGKTPIESFSENGYLIEVYGWRAGIPIKTHNYYAVYIDAAPHIFQMHYMNELDRTDISRPPFLIHDGPVAPPVPMSINLDNVTGGTGEGRSGRGRGGKRPPGDSHRPPADDGSSPAPAETTPSAAPAPPSTPAPSDPSPATPAPSAPPSTET